MNLEQIEKIAKAVLYEGYMLYPYRPSSVKNQQRWNFGVLYPKAYSDAQEGNDPWRMQVECLITGTAAAEIEGTVRFLQLQAPADLEGSAGPSIQRAVERSVSWAPVRMNDIRAEDRKQPFEFPIENNSSTHGRNEPAENAQEMLRGEIEVTADPCGENLLRLRVQIWNATVLDHATTVSRDQALMHSLISCHVVLRVHSGAFVSSLEPQPEFAEAVARCQNVGAWPVLVGEPGARDTLLASPIILYDYPKIAPESPGDLFDGTEIDEILSLRILTLTEQEKGEIRQSDERARQILDRTEQLPAEQFTKLHGAVRSLRPLRENEL